MASATRIFVGIDVACAQRKRLPICVAGFRGDRLESLELPPEIARALPLGPGNIEILQDAPFRSAAVMLAGTLDRGAKKHNWEITRVAIDAPAAPPATGERVAEKALRQRGLSSFQTPDEKRWHQIFRTCREHLRRGGALSRTPHANKIWMLYGFEIFEALRAIGHEVIEVYPYAIVRALLPECPHKRTAEGYRRQLESVAAATNWLPLDLERALRRSVPGTKDDKLDAFMAAWVASSPNTSAALMGMTEIPVMPSGFRDRPEIFPGPQVRVRLRCETKIRARWSTGVSELQDKNRDLELGKFWASCPDDAHERHRTWTGRWW